VLLAAARIATVEARHAAWMRTILGLNPAPNAFDGRRGKPETLRVVASTGFIVSYGLLRQCSWAVGWAPPLGRVT
jgi:hypothetical protein